MTTTETPACPSEQVIIDYLKGRLNETDRFQLEDHLLDCPLCAETIESLERHGLPELGELEGLVTRSEVSQTKTKKKQEKQLKKGLTQVGSLKSVSNNAYPLIRPVLAVAASVLLLLGLFGWYRSQTTEQQLFAEYFEPIPRYGYVSVRSLGASSDEVLATALRAQSSGDYSLSIASWNAYLESESDNADYRPHLYLALAQIEIGRLEEAAENLNQLPPSFDTEIGEEAEWYRALLYLRLEKEDEAKYHLKRLSSSGRTVYKNKSDILLRKLEL
ncbi:MAG: hypothetical protein AAF741_09315 [Bacteroidota bacterium]